MPHSIRDLFNPQFSAFTLSTLQVASILRVHPANIRRLDIPVVATTSRRAKLFRVSDVANYIERRGLGQPTKLTA